MAKKVNLDPYLFFKGNCREAMEFYKQIFGGELDVMTYSQAPGVEGGNPDWIMHASLRNEDFAIMASDTEEASEQAKKISLSLGGEDEERLTKIFDALSEGGKVNSPLKKEFWGDTFGSLVDKYGVDWMVNIAAAKE
jgi:PhnB protein